MKHNLFSLCAKVSATCFERPPWYYISSNDGYVKRLDCLFLSEVAFKPDATGEG